MNVNNNISYRDMSVIKAVDSFGNSKFYYYQLDTVTELLKNIKEGVNIEHSKNVISDMLENFNECDYIYYEMLDGTTGAHLAFKTCRIDISAHHVIHLRKLCIKLLNYVINNMTEIPASMLSGYVLEIIGIVNENTCTVDKEWLDYLDHIIGEIIAVINDGDMKEYLMNEFEYFKRLNNIALSIYIDM